MVCTFLFTSNDLVLYLRRENRWKLIDFGISAEVTTKKARATQYSRGTLSYRAPEILLEPATYSNKVDIWALGCVLYEVILEKEAFEDDLAVEEYYYNTSRLEVPVSWPPFFKLHISENLSDLLNRDWNLRPNAAMAGSIFSSYCRFLELRNSQDIAEIDAPPSYSEWKSICHETDFLRSLANLYNRLGNQTALSFIKKSLDNPLIERRQLIDQEIEAGPSVQQGPRYSHSAGVENDNSVVEDYGVGEMLLGSPHQSMPPPSGWQSGIDEAYLPVCYRSGKHIQLFYVAIRFTDEDDAIIFTRLRTSYEKHRGNKLWRRLSVYALDEIKTSSSIHPAG